MRELLWTAAAVKKISFNSAAADSDIVHFFTDFEEVMATRAPYTMYEEMLSRLSEQAVASSVREYTKQEVADMAVDSFHRHLLSNSLYGAAWMDSNTLYTP